MTDAHERQVSKKVDIVPIKGVEKISVSTKGLSIRDEKGNRIFFQQFLDYNKSYPMPPLTSLSLDDLPTTTLGADFFKVKNQLYMKVYANEDQCFSGSDGFSSKYFFLYKWSTANGFHQVRREKEEYYWKEKGCGSWEDEKRVIANILQTPFGRLERREKRRVYDWYCHEEGEYIKSGKISWKFIPRDSKKSIALFTYKVP